MKKEMKIFRRGLHLFEITFGIPVVTARYVAKSMLQIGILGKLKFYWYR